MLLSNYLLNLSYPIIRSNHVHNAQGLIKFIVLIHALTKIPKIDRLDACRTPGE